MIRAPQGDKKYWHNRVEAYQKIIFDKRESLRQPAKEQIYEAEYVFSLSKHHARLLLSSYSAGHRLKDLAQNFTGLLEAWELSNRLSDEICAKENLTTCRDWDFNLSNLNHYNWCFWLIGLALTLQIPNDQWQRLLILIGGAGEDVLLDRIIASRQPDRRIGSQLLHAKPYARLLKAIDAPKAQQASLLKEFVDHWYAELKRPPPKNKKAPTVEPFWYIYGDPVKHPLEMGSYFGRWCIEATAAVYAFQLDDSQCLGHEHYPGDLLRPDQPSTHIQRSQEAKRGWFSRLWNQ
jgi:Domain of unknown function (DUF1911)/Domain of unknown function (DUF1910)